MSNPNALYAPISEATYAAVAVACMSGVIVATITRSISVGSNFLFLIMVFAARIAIYEVPIPLSKILLSFIPVRVVIQSSFVSTIFSKSALFKVFSGKKDPTAVIEALIFFKLVI